MCNKLKHFYVNKVEIMNKRCRRSFESLFSSVVLKVHLGEGGNISMFSFCIDAFGSLIIESIYRPGSVCCYGPTGYTETEPAEQAGKLHHW